MELWSMSTVSLNRRLWAQVYREIFSGVCGRTYTSEENTADNESGPQGSGEGFSGRVANSKSKLGSKGYSPISVFHLVDSYQKPYSR